MCLLGYHPRMGKFKQWAETAALRTGNTVATPVRRWGSALNRIQNIWNQIDSSTKNMAEVSIQSRNALTDNFLNFSKVEGKRYQRMLKWWMNLASAVTRRPAMIAGAWVLSALNQGIRKPFTKLAPGKLFKDLKNSTRIFSKKKGFDFETYTRHETGWDTRVNQIKEKRIGFFGKGWNSEKKKTNEKPIEEKKTEEKKIEVKSEPVAKVIPPTPAKKPVEIPYNSISKEEMVKMEREKDDAAADAILAEHGYEPYDSFSNPKKSVDVFWNPKEWPKEEAKTIEELKKKNTAAAAEKDNAELEYRKWKSLDPKFKTQYEKEYKKIFNNNPTKAWVVERGKKNKKWETAEEIISTLKKDNNIELASYIEDEIINKAA